MKMVPCDKKVYEESYLYKKTKNHKIIDEFVTGNNDCVRLEGWTNVTAESCISSLNHTIKKFHKDRQLKAFSKQGEVYLIKLDK